MQGLPCPKTHTSSLPRPLSKTNQSALYAPLPNPAHCMSQTPPHPITFQSQMPLRTHKDNNKDPNMPAPVRDISTLPFPRQSNTAAAKLHYSCPAARTRSVILPCTCGMVAIRRQEPSFYRLKCVGEE